MRHNAGHSNINGSFNLFRISKYLVWYNGLELKIKYYCGLLRSIKILINLRSIHELLLFYKHYHKLWLLQVNLCQKLWFLQQIVLNVKTSKVFGHFSTVSTRNSKILTMALLVFFLVIYNRQWIRDGSIFSSTKPKHDWLLPESLNLPDLIIKLLFFDFRTILCSNHFNSGKNTEVNKQSVVMIRHSWRKFGSILYFFSCIKRNLFLKKLFSRKNL